MQKAMPLISKQMLVNQLRELEEDKIIERIIYAEIPPRVECKITKYSKLLMPILFAMQNWGLKDLKNRQISNTQIT